MFVKGIKHFFGNHFVFCCGRFFNQAWLHTSADVSKTSEYSLVKMFSMLLLRVTPNIGLFKTFLFIFFPMRIPDNVPILASPWTNFVTSPLRTLELLG